MQSLSQIWQQFFNGTVSDIESRQMEIDRAQRNERINDSFRNQYWTRVIRVDTILESNIQRHALISDIIEAYEEIDEFSDYIGLDHQVHFDPREFSNNNPNPSRAEYELSYDDLEQWGIICSSL